MTSIKPTFIDIRSLLKSLTYDYSQFQTVRPQLSLAAKQSKYLKKTHVYKSLNRYLKSWNAPKDLKEVVKKLAPLWRDYTKWRCRG
uniref:Uncharacterized protein n=1 Tax=Kalanchoe fedtschenkoi TaxID=63787 RepID=A0A7N0ZXB8_KALFE